jgi:hypothetical protein
LSSSSTDNNITTSEEPIDDYPYQIRPPNEIPGPDILSSDIPPDGTTPTNPIPDLAPSDPTVPIITYADLYSLLLDDDDYFTNPLVSTMVSSGPYGAGGDELEQLIKSLGTPPTATGTTTQLTVPPATITQYARSFLGSNTSTDSSLLRPDVSKPSKTFVSDPFSYEGKIVKFGRFYVENIEVKQNSSWSGFQNLYEQGRLMGFSITCNDADMIPNCYLENDAGTQDIMNDLSFKDSVIHGRGMTHGEATSTIQTPDGLVSRDVSGQQLTLFPYISRYKDQYTGSGVYDDVKNTVDDKSYVMHFEPTLFIPYQHLYFNVFNGSTAGNRLINRLEIKRLIYVDPDPVSVSTTKSSDLSQFSKTINAISKNLNSTPVAARTPVPPNIKVPPSNLVSAHMARQHHHHDHHKEEGSLADKLYEEFITYAYHRINEKNITRAKMESKAMQRVSSMEEQKELNKLLRLVNNEPEFKPVVVGTGGEVRHKSYDPNTMYIKWN